MSHRWRTRGLLGCLALGACTSLGPMPATTGVSAEPAGRPGVELATGPVPAFLLSQATTPDQRGVSQNQAAATLEPDRWLHLPGLVVGARVIGRSGDALYEPYVGYRTRFGGPDGALALAGIAYGTTNHAQGTLATYHAKRAGGELALDARIVQPWRWMSVHAQGAVAATAISATGTYCVDAMGLGTDCDTKTPANNTVIDGKLSGVYAAATATLAVDLGRASTGGFHGARIALLGAAGEMPTVVAGHQRRGSLYGAFGLTLTVGLGPAN